MAYIGRGLDKISNIEVLDAITFTDSAGPYNLLKGGVAFVPASGNNLVISIDGIIQSPSSYTLSGSTITFDSSMASTSTMNFIYQMGVGLVTTPADGSVDTAQLAPEAVTSTKIADNSITGGKIGATLDISSATVTLPGTVGGLGTGLTNSQLQNNSITINGSAVSLGGSVTGIGTETYPTVTGVTPGVITNAQTTVTIAGTNFISVPVVEAINSSGAITSADTVSYTSGTAIDATFTLPVDGTYFIRVENNDGLAARSSTAILNVSDVPAWVTTGGSLGTFSGSSALPTQTLTCTDATSFAVQSGTLTAGLTLNSGSGSATITGTQTAHTSAATDTFTIRATDAEGQTSDREFSLTWSFTIAGSGGFN